MAQGGYWKGTAEPRRVPSPRERVEIVTRFNADWMHFASRLPVDDVCERLVRATTENGKGVIMCALVLRLERKV